MADWPQVREQEAVPPALERTRNRGGQDCGGRTRGGQTHGRQGGSTHPELEACAWCGGPDADIPGEVTGGVAGCVEVETLADARGREVQADAGCPGGAGAGCELWNLETVHFDRLRDSAGRKVGAEVVNEGGDGPGCPGWGHEPRGACE